MSDKLTITLIPPHNDDPPSYRFSHNPSREWVESFTGHLSKIVYQHKLQKTNNAIFAVLFVHQHKFKLDERNSNYYKSDCMLNGFIKHIKSRKMELECQWNELMELHPLIIKAHELANIDVPDSVYVPGPSGSSSRLDIYNYLTKERKS